MIFLMCMATVKFMIWACIPDTNVTDLIKINRNFELLSKAHSVIKEGHMLNFLVWHVFFTVFFSGFQNTKHIKNFGRKEIQFSKVHIYIIVLRNVA